MFPKKLAFSVIYSSIFYVAFKIFCLFVPNKLVPQLIVAGICAIIISGISYTFRTGSTIKKKNYEQDVRDRYNESFHNKLQFITGSKEFKNECICFVIVSILTPVIICLLQIRSTDQLLRNIGRLLGVFAVILVFGIIIDLAVWLLAYSKSFKRKKY